ncbi:MAG TPA: NADH-quinone oxidoreductase subunit B [Bdellovibrionales bacterium]|nr:MAG: NADH dehydrogenase [Bdellovibrionales bacterium GWB1_52_6]OFZ03092.1 MAG: NADH dehydrogenase [Bdellovibrionales bacterium GWA1_52_35]HAR43008.1 NADH-quinone oxidoreductase subunit B [Bdellovibrionales bacterium]HCM40420.1 NADH-quinone oxidoreductase subunit B [Bdellovibrionales bacterium]
MSRHSVRSPWLLHFNAGSCNGCDVEILACLAPKYDIERFGIVNTGNPIQADILLITGPITKRARERVVELYVQMPEPKVVIAVGACACTGGVFRGMYNVENGVDSFIPVDVYIPGCSAHPEQIIDGVVKSLGILAGKNKEMEFPTQLRGPVTIDRGQVDRRGLAGSVASLEKGCTNRGTEN